MVSCPVKRALLPKLTWSFKLSWAQKAVPFGLCSNSFTNVFWGVFLGMPCAPRIWNSVQDEPIERLSSCFWRISRDKIRGCVVLSRVVLDTTTSDRSEFSRCYGVLSGSKINVSYLIEAKVKHLQWSKRCSMQIKQK